MSSCESSDKNKSSQNKEVCSENERANDTGMSKINNPIKVWVFKWCRRGADKGDTNPLTRKDTSTIYRRINTSLLTF